MEGEQQMTTGADSVRDFLTREKAAESRAERERRRWEETAPVREATSKTFLQTLERVRCRDSAEDIQCLDDAVAFIETERDRAVGPGFLLPLEEGSSDPHTVARRAALVHPSIPKRWAIQRFTEKGPVGPREVVPAPLILSWASCTYSGTKGVDDMFIYELAKAVRGWAARGHGNPKPFEPPEGVHHDFYLDHLLLQHHENAFIGWLDQGCQGPWFDDPAFTIDVAKAIYHWWARITGDGQTQEISDGVWTHPACNGEIRFDAGWVPPRWIIGAHFGYARSLFMAMVSIAHGVDQYGPPNRWGLLRRRPHQWTFRVMADEPSPYPVSREQRDEDTLL